MILTLLLAPLLAQSSSIAVMEGDDSAAPAAEQDVSVIETERDRARRMTLAVDIDGEGPFTFFIDTGSQATVVSRELRERLALENDGIATLVSVAGRSEVKLVRLDGLVLGDRIINGLTAPVLERANLGADGIIGVDSLQHLSVLLDFKNRLLSVADGNLPNTSNGYEIVVRARSRLGRLVIADADIDGIRTRIVVDTGAEASIGNETLRRRLRAKKLASVTATDVTGTEIQGDLDYAKTMRIGKVTVNNLAIAFADAHVFDALDLARRPALILGMRDLESFDRVAIDFASQRILFDVPDNVDRLPAVQVGTQPSRL